MGIQPTTDLLFDVVKAADSSRSREVIGKLREMSADGSGAFATNLAEADRAPGAKTDPDTAKAAAMLPVGMGFSGATLVGLRNAHVLSQPNAAAAPASSADSLRKFEGMMLSQFIDAMMPAQKGVFGTGLAGSTWKSMLTEKLGNQMANAGGIGMASRLARAHTAFNTRAASKGVMS